MTALRLAVGPLMQQGGLSGHAGVADWVSNNSADVLAYYPMSDASASGTMSDDSGNGRDGSYGSGISAGTVDGETVADFNNSSTDIATVSYASWMDSISGVFFVIKTGTSLADNDQIMSRDEGTGGQRSFQFRAIVSTPPNWYTQFIKIDGTGGTDTEDNSGSVYTTGTVYTWGWRIDGSSLHWYVNGVNTQTDTLSSAPPASTADLMFGHRYQSGSPTDFLDAEMGSFVVLGSHDADTIPDLHAAWAGS